MEPLRFPETKRTIRSRALSLIKERSFSRGEVALASGKKSDFYFDMKPSMLHGEGAHLLATLVYDKIKELKVDYVGGLEMGAVPLLSPIGVISHQDGGAIPGFFVRQKIKDHGTKKLIEGLAPGETLGGKRVIIVEDVTTTGGSAMVAVTAAREAGAEIVMVLSIVDREEGAAAFYKQQGIRFDAVFTTSDFRQG
jgi:orotate phosphoribosyltransferase